jgi:hypothetical protein
VHGDPPPVHYVLNHPGVVATSFAGEHAAATASAVDRLRITGKPVSQAVAQILPFLDGPATGLTAVLEGRRVPTDTPPSTVAAPPVSTGSRRTCSPGSRDGTAAGRRQAGGRSGRSSWVVMAPASQCS